MLLAADHVRRLLAVITDTKQTWNSALTLDVYVLRVDVLWRLGYVSMESHHLHHLEAALKS